MENLVDTRQLNRGPGGGRKTRKRTLERKKKRKGGLVKSRKRRKPNIEPKESTTASSKSGRAPYGRCGECGAVRSSSDDLFCSKCGNKLKSTKKEVKKKKAVPIAPKEPEKTAAEIYEAKEIAYLEKKLGIKSGKEWQSNDKLMKELNEDGLGDLLSFVGKFEANPILPGFGQAEEVDYGFASADEEEEMELAAEYDREAEEAISSVTKQYEAKYNDEEEEEEEEEEEDGEEEEEEEEEMVDEELEEEEEEEEEEEDDDDDDDEEEEEEEEELEAHGDDDDEEDMDVDNMTPLQRLELGIKRKGPLKAKDSNKSKAISTQLFGQDVEALHSKGSSGSASTGSYIPPHLRKKVAGNSGVFKEIRKQVKGHLNRLTQANIDPISNQIVQLYSDHNRRDVNEALMDIVIKSCCSEEQVLLPVVLSCASLMACLHLRIDHAIGSLFLERFVLKFEDARKGGRVHESKNLALFIVHLYVFQIVHCQLIYDMIRLIADRFTVLDVDLLAVVIQYSGFQLRRDDPGSLKQIILLIQTKAATFANKTGSATVEDGQRASPARVRFILDMIYDLKNNKRRHQEQAESIAPIQTWLKTAATTGRKKKTNQSQPQLRLTWDDLINADKKGRWWLVGAAWSAGGGSSSLAGSNKKTEEVEEEGELLKLSKKHRMNTDVKKAVFCVVMAAEDYMDAFEKLMKLNLKPKQQPAIVQVLLQCCSKEKKFNPYYAILLNKLCHQERRYRFSTRLAIWDVISNIESGKYNTKELGNVARLAAYLVLEKALSLAVIKKFDFNNLPEDGILFVYTFLLFLFRSLRSGKSKVVRSKSKKVGPHFIDPTEKGNKDEVTPIENLTDILSYATKNEDLSDARQGLIIFVHRYMLNSAKKGTGQHKLIQDGIKVLKDVLG